LKNIGGHVNKQIEDFRVALLELRNAFLDEATITTEITALQILDGMGIISADVGKISSNVTGISSQLDGVATQLKWVSSQVSDVVRSPDNPEGYRSEDCHRARCKNQRNPIWDRIALHT